MLAGSTRKSDSLTPDSYPVSAPGQVTDAGAATLARSLLEGWERDSFFRSLRQCQCGAPTLAHLACFHCWVRSFFICAQGKRSQ